MILYYYFLYYLGDDFHDLVLSVWQRLITVEQQPLAAELTKRPGKCVNGRRAGQGWAGQAGGSACCRACWPLTLSKDPQ